MARLAALQEGLGPSPAKGPTASDKERSEAYRRRLIRTYFGCGVATSLVFGCAALLPMVYANSSIPQQVTPADATALLPGLQTRVRTAAEVVELAIRRDHAGAPFPVQISGAGSGSAVNVVLRNLPEGAWLSNGERQDEHTWQLRETDLDALHLTLRRDAPETFDVVIEVASQSSGEVTRSVARIRLIDAPAPSQQIESASGGKPSAPQVGREDATVAAQRSRTQAATQRPTDTAPAKAAQKAALVPAGKSSVSAPEETTAQAVPSGGGIVRVTRPDGMSTLGAVARDDSPADARQLWWKLPLPSWAPFNDGASTTLRPR